MFFCFIPHQKLETKIVINTKKAFELLISMVYALRKVNKRHLFCHEMRRQIRFYICLLFFFRKRLPTLFQEFQPLSSR